MWWHYWKYRIILWSTNSTHCGKLSRIWIAQNSSDVCLMVTILFNDFRGDEHAPLGNQLLWKLSYTPCFLYLNWFQNHETEVGEVIQARTNPRLGQILYTNDLAVLQLLQCIVHGHKEGVESLWWIKTLHDLFIGILDFVSILEQLSDLCLNCSSILQIFPVVLT